MLFVQVYNRVRGLYFKKQVILFGLKLTLFLPTEILGGITCPSLFSLLVGTSRGRVNLEKLPKQCKKPQCYSIVRVCA